MSLTAAAGTAPFIAIEGIDGAGTTTQVVRLQQWLLGLGHQVHVTREPSTGPVGVLLRDILVGTHGHVPPRAVGLLYAADRVDHLAREIEPARVRGHVVISDRYVMSSFAYQTLALSRDEVAAMNCGAAPPDLTVLVDVPVEVALARRQMRGGPVELFDAAEVQRRVAVAYRTEVDHARAAGQRVLVVDGRPDADQVFATLQRELAVFLGVSL